MSMLTLPQMIANLFTRDYKRMIWGSMAIGFAACVAGLWLSYFLNISSGAFIILLLVVAFLLAKGLRKQ